MRIDFISWFVKMVAVPFCTALLSLFVSPNAYAIQTVVVLDQFGNPVRNAVVSVSVAETLQPSETKKKTTVIDQVNKRFVPRVSSIRAGEYISFPNSDDIRHHVYSFSPAKVFEIKLYRGKDTKPLLFDTPGIVALGCNIHDRMRGFIYVSSANERISISDMEGIARISVVDVAGQNELYLWHENLMDPTSRTKITPGQITRSSEKIILRITLRHLVDNPSKGFRKRFSD